MFGWLKKEKICVKMKVCRIDEGKEMSDPPRFSEHDYFMNRDELLSGNKLPEVNVKDFFYTLPYSEEICERIFSIIFSTHSNSRVYDVRKHKIFANLYFSDSDDESELQIMQYYDDGNLYWVESFIIEIYAKYKKYHSYKELLED